MPDPMPRNPWDPPLDPTIGNGLAKYALKRGLFPLDQ